jgi:integrase
VTSSTTPTLLAGVKPHRNGYRVRKAAKHWRTPARPDGRVVETYATPAEANRRALDLDERIADGRPPSDELELDDDPLLRTAADELLTRKRTQVSPKTKRKLDPEGLAYWTRSLEPWRTGPHAATRLSALRRRPLEDELLERAVVAPTSARNERQALLATLDYAGERGRSFDAAILRIPPIAVEAAVRHALDAFELEYLGARVPAIGRRLVLLQGTVGNRIEELFLAEPAHLELDATRLVDGERRPAPVLFVPAAHCKERRDKRVPLTLEEVALAREQLGGLRVVDESSSTAGCPAMPAGGPRLFMTAGVQVYPTGTVRRTKTGPTPWRHSQWDRLVWQPAVARAAADWRAEHELADVVVAGRTVPAPTPFEWWVDPATAPPDGRRRAADDGRRWITTHDLRATAVTLMRDAGVAKADCAARVGHADGGVLVDAIYDQGDRAARAGRALEAAAPLGLRAAMGR